MSRKQYQRFTSDWAVFDTMIVAEIDKEWNYDPSKSTSWKVLETVLSHLNEPAYPNAILFEAYFNIMELKLSSLLVCLSKQWVEQWSQKLLLLTGLFRIWSLSWDKYNVPLCPCCQFNAHTSEYSKLLVPTKTFCQSKC